MPLLGHQISSWETFPVGPVCPSALAATIWGAEQKDLGVPACCPQCSPPCWAPPHSPRDELTVSGVASLAPKGWWEVGAHERLSMSPVSPASPGARLGTIGALCHGMGGGPIPCRMGFPQSQPSPHPRSHPRPCPRPCRGRHRPQGAAALAHRPHSRRRLPLPRLCGPAHQPALADQDAQVGRHGGDASCTRLGGRGLPARGGPGCCGVGTGPSPGTAQPLSPLAGSTAASRRPRGLRGTTVWALWGWHRAPHRPGLSSPLGTC